MSCPADQSEYPVAIRLQKRRGKPELCRIRMKQTRAAYPHAKSPNRLEKSTPPGDVPRKAMTAICARSVANAKKRVLRTDAKMQSRSPKGRTIRSSGKRVIQAGERRASVILGSGTRNVNLASRSSRFGVQPSGCTESGQAKA